MLFETQTEWLEMQTEDVHKLMLVSWLKPCDNTSVNFLYVNTCLLWKHPATGHAVALCIKLTVFPMDSGVDELTFLFQLADYHLCVFYMISNVLYLLNNNKGQ